jgi:signal transduction histidine kinase
MRRSFNLVLDERTRISRELHDTILQSLAGLALQIEGLAQQNDGLAVATGLRRLRRGVEQHIHDARHAILGLRSGSATERPLAERLQASASELLASTAMHVDCVVTGEARALLSQQEEQVMRIAQEAIRNAARHSGAQAVSVTLAYDAAGLVLTVRDDGQGFTLDEVTDRESERWGVMGMQERARKIGARFSLQSTPGTGTTVTVEVPSAPAED